LVPADHTRLIVEKELEAAQGWAGRHGVEIDWLPEVLELRVPLRQPETGELFFLRGDFRDYKALAPEWTFADEKWQGGGRAVDFPKVGPTRFGAPIFMTHNQTAVICVPFNRLAYADHAGPHKDWGGPANWLNAGLSQIHAETVGDMLQAVYRDFCLTRERMANR
jgi:hypothetical protein